MNKMIVLLPILVLLLIFPRYVPGQTFAAASLIQPNNLRCTPDIINLPLLNSSNLSYLKTIVHPLSNTSRPLAALSEVAKISNTSNLADFKPILASGYGETSANVHNIHSSALLLIGRTANTTISIGKAIIPANTTTLIGKTAIEGGKGVEILAGVKPTNVSAISGDNIRTKTIDLISNLMRVDCNKGGLVVIFPPLSTGAATQIYKEGNSAIHGVIYEKGQNVGSLTADCTHVNMECNTKVLPSVPVGNLVVVALIILAIL